MDYENKGFQLEGLTHFAWWVIGVFGVLLVLAVCSGLIYAIAKRRQIARKTARRWRSLPTLLEYTARHPRCQTALGIRCARCKSPNIHDVGMATVVDKRRRFICGHCGKTLYRGYA